VVSETAAVEKVLSTMPAVKPFTLLKVFVYLPKFGLVAAGLLSVYFVGDAVFVAKKPQTFHFSKFFNTRIFFYVPFQAGSWSYKIGKKVTNLTDQNLGQLCCRSKHFIRCT
jgi:hypothetical protein